MQHCQTHIPTLARGRWAEILPALGISADFLSNKHGPCPGCGKDRFRFADKDERRPFVCGCGGAARDVSKNPQRSQP